MSVSSGRALSRTVTVERLTVTYRGGTVGLEDVSLSLDQPTICGLIGMNGAGKSTLFKAIMGFVAPTRGSVEVCGRPVAWARKQNVIAYVPQTEDVDWTFPVSVRDVVMMGRQARMGFMRVPSRGDAEIVLESLERVGMVDLVERQIGELSGGQRKRVFLARALAQRSGIVLLDEPFTGVDVKTEHAIIGVLRELKAAGDIIVVSTHNLSNVETYCDTVMMINRRLIAFGSTDAVFTVDNLGETFVGAIHHLADRTVLIRPNKADVSSTADVEKAAT